MREQLNRILRIEKIELPGEDPKPLLQMLSVVISELSNSTPPNTINTPEMAALAARSVRHVFSMISSTTETDEHRALKKRILINTESMLSRHIPGIAVRFANDFRERMLIRALYEVADTYRNIPREWLPYVPTNTDWHAFASANLSDMLHLADRISRNSYVPTLNNSGQLLVTYAAIRDVA